MIGYITFYFKVETNKGTSYTEISHDFTKFHVTMEEYAKEITEQLKQVYENLDFEVKNIDFCTKEEYQEECSDEILVSHEWNEN